MEPILENFESVKKVCKCAVDRYVGNGKLINDEREELLQDAFLIAYAPRGKKEIRSERELFWKVYFGLIDKYRKDNKIQRKGRLKKEPRQRPTFVRYESVGECLLDGVASKRWTANLDRIFIQIKRLGSQKKIVMSYDEFQDRLTNALKRTPAYSRERIERILAGDELSEVAAHYGVQKSTIEFDLYSFRKMILDVGV